MPRNATELTLFGVALIWIWILRVLKALLRLSIKALPRNATELTLFGVALIWIWILRVLKALLRLSIKALQEGWGVGGGGVGKREAKGKMSLP